MNRSEFEAFQPVWWAWNTHIHTVVASQLTPVQKPDCRRLEIPTPDNDFLEVDMLINDEEKPIVALFHGLEGSTNRHYIANLMDTLNKRGFSSAALNFRGCGSRMNNRPRFYHSGETDDYRTFLGWLKHTYPQKQIYAVGYSLGGNALVKYLAEEGSEGLIDRAVAVSPPYDLKEGSIRMQQGINRIYEVRFLKTLVEKLEMKRKKYPGLPEFHGTTIYDFDDQVTAKLHHFEGADDYYQQCSSRHFYGGVKTDLLVIHSKEDTLCPIEFAPLTVMDQNSHIRRLFTDEGGHVGFLSSEPGWLYRVILKWFQE